MLLYSARRMACEDELEARILEKVIGRKKASLCRGKQRKQNSTEKKRNESSPVGLIIKTDKYITAHHEPATAKSSAHAESPRTFIQKLK